MNFTGDTSENVSENVSEAEDALLLAHGTWQHGTLRDA